MDADNKKPFKIKDVTRNIKKAVVAASLEEIRSKVAEKFEKSEQPTIHLDSDGTEVDDEEYFRTLDANTELIAVFPGEHWVDPTHYVTITTQRENGDTTDAAAEAARIKQLVGQLQNNLCNVSAISDPDLDSLSNMDPNSLVDITGKDFMEQLKDSGRPLCAKRNAQDRINLLKLLKDGAIFCSERYPEDAEAIDMEISRQLNIETTTTNITKTINIKTIEQVQNGAATMSADEEITIVNNISGSDVAATQQTTNTNTTTTTKINDI
ncbi:DNA fragmentation factor subunit alpha [Teleopsis dalmanni]|uniref:DNA fragmentation factor subunit alpha n=1 Tax=Teleopsis dalmanni TaxID=139649 RepID=UPI0018CF9482|nr:DNA fragmentation factor subunit alpha [Teleopsis dalmanni]